MQLSCKIDVDVLGEVTITGESKEDVAEMAIWFTNLSRNLVQRAYPDGRYKESARFNFREAQAMLESPSESR